jgi:hypothetical protein
MRTAERGRCTGSSWMTTVREKCMTQRRRTCNSRGPTQFHRHRSEECTPSSRTYNCWGPSRSLLCTAGPRTEAPRNGRDWRSRLFCRSTGSACTRAHNYNRWSPTRSQKHTAVANTAMPRTGICYCSRHTRRNTAVVGTRIGTELYPRTCCRSIAEECSSERTGNSCC